MSGVDSTGFESKTVLEIQDEINASIRGAISPTLNLSAASLMGEFVGACANQIGQTWEAAEDIYAGEDIDQATGDRLTALCRETGTNRNPSTYSTVLMTITLDAGTYAAGALVVHVVGDATLRFANDSRITTAGATLTDQAFTAEEIGPVRANAATLTFIADPYTGFTAPTNPAEAVLGLDEESDYALRLRQKTELARRGSHTVDAIRVDLMDAEIDISSCSVVENDTDATVDSIPPHSFEALVLGGDTQDVVDAIFEAKPAGIRAYGTTSGTAIDAQGNSHAISFTRPANIPIFVDVAVSIVEGDYEGDLALKKAITDWADPYLLVGYDVLRSKIVAVCMALDGVVDCSIELGLGPTGSGTAAANYVITSRQYATINQANITIAQTLVTGNP